MSTGAVARVVPPALRVPLFRDVWLATVGSNAGTWFQNVAAGWLVLVITDSPAAVGALALLARGPAVVLATYGGHLADRYDRRAVAIFSLLLQAAGAGALAIVAAFQQPSVALIYASTFVVGAGFAIGLPATLALIPTLVPKELFSQSVSLNAVGINVARLAGPAVGGVALVVFGAAVCFAVNAATFLLLVWALSRVGPRKASRTGEGSSSRAAYRFALGDPAMRRLLLGMAIFTGLASSIQELAPAIADRLDSGAEGLGFLLGALGGGGLLGAFILERTVSRGLARSRALPLATLLFAIGFGLVALAPTLPLALAAMLASGMFWIWMFAGTNTALQLRSPRELVGRMLGLYQLSVVAPIAVGPVVLGVLAEEVGISTSLLLAAALLAAWGLWSLLNPVREIDVHLREGHAGPDIGRASRG